jgi:hypothetical protein
MQAGGGVQIPAGYYVRVGVDVAVGGDFTKFSTETSGRLDLIGRFLFDPFRQSRWGFSAGGGVSLRVHEGDQVRPDLVALLDLEGPRTSNGIAPAVQLGLGGGVRLGVVVRWSPRQVR